MLFGVLAATLGVVLGNFVGYWVHRAIHEPWAGPLHRGHMEHHLEIYPSSRLTSDKYELKRWYNSGPILFTPAALLLLGFGALATHALGVSLWHFAAFGGSLVAFGMLNDYVHDSFHVRRHPLQRWSYYRRLRRSHFLHHFDMGRNYGIVSLTWDVIFKTKTDT